MRELFIYYRAKVADEPALQATATQLQAHLQTRFAGLRARLLRRPDAVDGLHTWMETYALPPTLAPHGISDAMQRDIEAAATLALAPFLVGTRHLEVFIACAS